MHDRGIGRLSSRIHPDSSRASPSIISRHGVDVLLMAEAKLRMRLHDRLAAARHQQEPVFTRLADISDQHHVKNRQLGATRRDLDAI
jgi:hypothetical protein